MNPEVSSKAVRNKRLTSSDSLSNLDSEQGKDNHSRAQGCVSRRIRLDVKNDLLKV
nr:MAG TPA: hypothetical protein [Caudoviricetes sp.]